MLCFLALENDMWPRRDRPSRSQQQGPSLMNLPLRAGGWRRRFGLYFHHCNSGSWTSDLGRSEPEPGWKGAKSALCVGEKWVWITSLSLLSDRRKASRKEDPNIAKIQPESCLPSLALVVFKKVFPLSNWSCWFAIHANSLQQASIKCLLCA